MAKLFASNIGTRTQAIKVRGGSVSLRPNASLPVEPHPDLDEEKIAHFASLGVTFSVPGEKPQDADVKGQKKVRRPAVAAAPDADKVAAEKAAAEKAAADKVAAEKAAAEKAAAEKAAADKADAVKAAEDTVLAAMTKLEKAGDDMVAKAAAEAALAALKA